MKKNVFYLFLAIFLAAVVSSYVKTTYKANDNAIHREDMIVVAKLFSRGDASWLQERVDWAKRLGANQFLIFPDQVMREGCAEVLNNSGIDLWLISPTFYHDDNRGTSESASAQLAALGREPKWAICDDGEIAQQQGSWLRMVCPNDQEYINYRIEALKPAFRACKVTGLSLDFIRYFLYWEGTRPYTNPQSLRNSCFCDDCINDFANTSANIKTALDGVKANGGSTVEIAAFIKKNYINQWTNYKCGKIDKTIEHFLTELRKEFPDLKSNIHAVPYTSNDHNGAIKSIVGQDFALLSKRVDQISLMTYNVMCERPAQWLNDVTYDVAGLVNGRVPVVPTIQGNAGGITNADYEAMITNALKSPSSGIVIWQFERLSEERIDIIDRVLNGK